MAPRDSCAWLKSTLEIQKFCKAGVIFDSIGNGFQTCLDRSRGAVALGKFKVQCGLKEPGKPQAVLLAPARDIAIQGRLMFFDLPGDLGASE